MLYFCLIMPARTPPVMPDLIGHLSYTRSAVAPGGTLREDSGRHQPTGRSGYLRQQIRKGGKAAGGVGGILFPRMKRTRPPGANCCTAAWPGHLPPLRGNGHRPTIFSSPQILPSSDHLWGEDTDTRQRQLASQYLVEQPLLQGDPFLRKVLTL